MVLTIKNFGNPVGPGVVETAPTNLVGVAGIRKATLTWTSATGESGVVWTEEMLVRKEGSAPQGSMDGTVVTTITTKDTYATNGYEDTGLDETKTYYYKVFAVYDNGTEKGSSAINVTPLAPYEYYYNFVDAGSVGQMQTDGWSFYRKSGSATNGRQFTSNGLHNTISSDGDTKYAQTYGPEVLDCTNATKITIEVEHYLVSGNLNGLSFYAIAYGRTSYSGGTVGGGGYINAMRTSGINGYSCFSSSQETWNKIILATGNYTGTTVIDLVNKTIITSLSGQTDLTLTLSDADITAIRQAKSVIVHYDNTGNYYKSIKVTIE